MVASHGGTMKTQEIYISEFDKERLEELFRGSSVISVNRMIVAESILDTLGRNGGDFRPSGNLFLELERDDDSS
jgi:hypothetical protein